MKNDLNRLLNPSSVVVFGVSEQEGKAGNSVVRQLLEGTVRVYGINPKGGTLFGSILYRNVDELPEVPDLAVITLPAELAPEAARACARRGIGAVIVIAGGFGEIGALGRKLEQELKEAIVGTHTRILGPNTLGLFIPRLNLDTNFLPATHLRRPKSGNIAIISQSGSGVMGALDVGAFYGVGLAVFVGLGNRVDIDENELIEYFADDPNISAIGIYLESFSDAQRFVNVCQRVSPRKPIVIVKAGRSSAGARAVALHTGSLAGSDRVTGDVLRQLGVFRAYDDEELIDTARALAYTKPFRGNRVAILTGGGGMGVITADYVEAHEEGIAASLAVLDPNTMARMAKITVPYASVHNPIDLTPAITVDMLVAALDIVQEDPGVDVIIVCLEYHTADSNEYFTDRLCRWGREGKKPLIVAAVGSETTMQAIRDMEAAGMLAFPSFWRAVKAVDILSKRAEFLYRVNSRQEEGLGPNNFSTESNILISEQTLASKIGSLLTEDEVKVLLRERGIKTSDFEVLYQGQLPAEIPFPFPLVVKIRSAEVLHKTEIKGVALNIRSVEELEMTVADMRSRFPGQDLLLERMEPPGVEIIVGLIEDGTFGQSIMCGIGGVLAEIYQDVTFRRVPINRLEAVSMLRDLKAHALFEGFRGIQANREAVIDLLVKVSRFGQDLRGHIDQMDLNPVIVREDKAVVVDAKLVWK